MAVSPHRAKIGFEMTYPETFHSGAFVRRFRLLAAMVPGWLACGLPAAEASPESNGFPAAAYGNVKDYGMMWWRSGLRDERVWQIKTSRYAMTFAADSLSLTNIFPLPTYISETEALVQSNELSFPASAPVSSLACSITSSGTQHSVEAFNHTTGSSHLVDSGKFFHRRWQKIKTTSGPDLNTTLSGLEICAWPDRISITCRVIPTNDVTSGQLDLTLDLANIYNILSSSGLAHSFAAGDGSGYVILKSSGTTTLTTDAANARVSVSTAGGTWLANQERSVGLVIYPTMNVAETLATANAIEGGQLTVTASQVAPSTAVLAPSYDLDRGYFNVPLRSDAVSSDENRIERSHVTVTNHAITPQVARFAFTKGSTPNIPGVTCIIRDLDGNPLGIPVQLSKNWHIDPLKPERWQGSWFHGLTMFTVPANTTLSFEVLMAGQNYGGVPAASHAQLSLVGYTENGNQQWDQAAIGSWGETFCYDPDSHLASAIGTDSRTLMQLNASGAQRGWTANYGGCDFLRYFDGSNTRRFQKRIRSHYQRYGPNLTDATYAGLTTDSKIGFKYSASLYRSNDFSRGLHRIRYDVKTDAAFTRMVFFQLASDNYNYGAGTTHAYGYGDQFTHTAQWTTGSLNTPTPLTGNLPWFSTLNCPSDGLRSLGGATRGFIIRSWNARINGVDGVKPHFVYNGSRFDLVPPPGVTSLLAGDYVEAEIERVYFVREADTYYGGDANHSTALQSYGNTHQMVIREAIGNNLTVNVTEGTLEKSYPIQIATVNGTAQFDVTRGVGYVPMTFTGISDYRDPRLEELIGDDWVAVNQAVYGKDFWQAEYEPEGESWQITFNVKLDGEYQNIVALRDAPVTRTFRLRQVLEPVIAPVTWDTANATSTSWSLASNWVGGVAPVNGDDVSVSADGAFSPTAHNGVEVNSLTLTGATNLTLSGLKVGAGGVYNMTAVHSLFLNATTLLADQTWGGSRTIFLNQATGPYKLNFDGSALRFDNNSPAWSGGLDVRTSVSMLAASFPPGAITPYGTGTITLINQRAISSTATSPLLQFNSTAANNSLATANIIANPIALSDQGTTGNFTFRNDASTGGGHHYILPGGITGTVHPGRTLSFTNNDAVAGPAPATFVLTGDNTYNAQTVIGPNTTLQIGSGGATGTPGPGAITNSGTLAFSRSGTLNVPNVISGTGKLHQRGSGITRLTAPNTYTGDTTVSEGTLAFEGGSMVSPVTVESGAFVRFTLGSPTSSSSSLTLQAGAKIQISGTPVSPHGYTLVTASGGITGTPVLENPIAGYSLVLEDSDTMLKLKFTGIGLNYVSWNTAAAITSSWADGANWLGNVPPAAGDDVTVNANGAVDPTNNSGYSEIPIRSLTLDGGTSLALTHPMQVAAGGVWNTMASNSLFLKAVHLTADQTWGGTRTIFIQGPLTGSKMSFDGSAARFDFASPNWSAGLDVRSSVNMGNSGFGTGLITPYGTGTITLVNRRSDGITNSNPSLGLSGSVNNISFATAQELANPITLSDPGSGNFIITQSNDATANIAHFYTLSGGIVGAVNTARSLSFTNSHTSPVTTPATFTLTGNNAYTARTVIGTNTTLQIGDGGTSGTLGSTAGEIANSGILAFNRSDVLSVPNVISGAGQVQQRGGGTTILSGNNTYTGNTTVLGGTLAFASGSLTSSVKVQSSAFMQFTLGLPTTSTRSVILESGAKIRIIGTPAAPDDYPLITAAMGITGTPVLANPISAYALVVESGGTALTLKFTGIVPSYSTWASAFDAPPLSDAAAMADPDNDGLANAMEYALGLDPRFPNASPGVASDDGKTITFTKGTEAIANGDVAYVIQTTANLATDSWADAASPEVTESADTISITFPNGPEKNFARLKVILNP
jgi:autotransporter-associated beta strand protein